MEPFYLECVCASPGFLLFLRWLLDIVKSAQLSGENYKKHHPADPSLPWKWLVYAKRRVEFCIVFNLFVTKRSRKASFKCIGNDWGKMEIDVHPHHLPSQNVLHILKIMEDVFRMYDLLGKRTTVLWAFKP